MNQLALRCIQSIFAMNVNHAVRTLAAFLLLAASAVWAQVPTLDPRTPGDPKAPVITFEFVLDGAVPPHYSIAIEAGGRAAYRSDDVARPAAETTGEQPYFVKFVVSEASAERIFDLAKSLNYFNGDFEFHGGRVANMGAKSLTFKNGDAENRLSYNYSQNPNLQQLTSLLQGIAGAVEYRRRLERLYRYEKLGLEDELKRMEEDVKRKYVTELQIDESILQQIANDRSVMNISRRRAENILAQIGDDASEPARNSGRNKAALPRN
jgi:hypothetical protein